MSEKDSFQQIQKLSQEQIQTQRATLNQMLLGELIEMNDEGIKERIDAELNDNPALEEASEASDNIDDFGDNNDEGDDDTTAEVGQGNDDPFESPYTQNDDDNTADTFDDGFALIASRTSGKRGLDV